MKIPKVFISYSHDDKDHKHWVLQLASALREAGIDAVLDQWDLQPGDDLPHFMEKNLREADFVLMICTDQYVQKANSGAGGVGYEKMIVTAELLRQIDNNKVIPILRQSGGTQLPTFLKSKLYINLSDPDHQEYGQDELIRTILKAPLYKKPELGSNPFVGVQPPEPVEPTPTKDVLVELMDIILAAYDNTSTSYISYTSLLDRITVSRLMFEYMLDQALAAGLIEQDNDRDIYITPKGRKFCFEKGLVRL